MDTFQTQGNVMNKIVVLWRGMVLEIGLKIRDMEPEFFFENKQVKDYWNRIFD